jgi:hypothetical protein
MFKKLWFYVICWKYRNTPFFELADQYSLLLKAARRCSYDMSHCSSELDMALSRTNEKAIIDFHERSRMWLGLFNPDGGKDYRHRLHHDINNLDLEISRLKRLCDEHKINHEDPDRIPF